MVHPCLEFKVCFFLTIIAIAVTIAHAQDLGDFISIDCGLSPTSNYYFYDDIGIPYNPDENFIDSGVNYGIAPEYNKSDTLERKLWTVRSFPEGLRNCYKLSAGQGEGNKYLIRATFLYGNYDSMNQTPTFELHLGVELWDSVTFGDGPNITVTKEILHAPSSNYTYVCLVNTGKGTPFISALELRPLPLDPRAYNISIGESLSPLSRTNFAPADTNQIIRYPDDKFDRVWKPKSTRWDCKALNTTSLVNENEFQAPVVVMQTAFTPLDANDPLVFVWTLPPDPSDIHFYFHFAEVVKLQSNESREFYIYLKDKPWYDKIVAPQYLESLSILVTRPGIPGNFEYSLRRTENSTHPPLINAMEVYTVRRFTKSETNEKDVGSIVNIKSTYGVNNRNWQGDPCIPEKYVWQGLDCIINTDNRRDPPRIKSLNLSSSGLNGSVSQFISTLTALENLDLSNNGLNGPVPDFLADLSSLKVLDLSNNNLNGLVPDFLADIPNLKVLRLSGNQFSAPLPQKLLDKANNGLELRADGYTAPNPCHSGQYCENKKFKKFVVPVVVSLLVSSIVLAAFFVLCRLRRRKQQGKKLGGISKSKRKDGFLEKKNIQFTYSDLLKITNNFEKILGKGGFGTVYHGLVNGEQVAVKLLSPSSNQGYHEFETEAELLMRVHHCNLTRLVGYCYEDSRMALIYEYMANGNLKELLAVKDDNYVLSWSKRLQIALDAAQGLDYLHNRCKPPIVHRDIKSTNILLNEKFEAKLADFGLCRVFNIDESSVSTRVIGTLGYLDPEYCESKRLNEKSDIYSLGVVILELITGRPAVIASEENCHITQWVSVLLATGDIGSIVDPKLEGMYEINSAWKALEVALACASRTSYRRPNMAKVLAELTDCLQAVARKAQMEEGLEETDSNGVLEVNLDALSELQPNVR